MNTIAHPELSETSQRILARRYLLKDDAGHVSETAEELFSRVARHVASGEREFSPAQEAQSEKEFFDVMRRFEFLPNSPTLMNAGTELGQLAGCFVLPVEDSIASIFSAVKDAASIHQSGGGCGFDFSKLRPRNDKVMSTQGIASGPVSFMSVFEAATETIKQGGKRRGANMGVLRVDHPDILEFIAAKAEEGRLQNFNLSVALTDRFMEALTRGEEFSLINPRTGREEKKIPARELFNAITEGAWRTGEPGIIFIDRINRDNPTPEIGVICATNPCGEVPLLAYESCNLGSVNLSLMTIDRNGCRAIDFDRLDRTVRIAVRFLDNVIEVNKYPIEMVENVTKANRKIGLGVMGFADCLIKLGIPYDSVEALGIAEKIMSHISHAAREESAGLARERGPFPNYSKSIYAKDAILPLRNATLTSIAPTGTISLIAGCSSGIEPIFAPLHRRKMLDGEEIVELHPLLVEMLKDEGALVDEAIRHLKEGRSIRTLSSIPEPVRRVFACAHEISYEWHVRMQAAFQKHVDSAVSKTINFPSDATAKDVGEAFLLAYKLGCKGITVYRDGSRKEQVLTAVTSTKGTSLSPRERPRRTFGHTTKVKVGCGKLYVTVNWDKQGICEVFTSPGRTGGCPAQSEAMSRVISIALRAGISESAVIHQLKGVVCQSCLKRDGVEALSCADAIGRVITDTSGFSVESNESFVPNSIDLGNSDVSALVCTECGGPTRPDGRCRVCIECGYRKCG